MSQGQNKPVKIPAALLPAVREYWQEDEEVGAQIDALTERMGQAQIRLTNKLIEAGLVAPGEKYQLDTRYLFDLGEAFIWKAEQDIDKRVLN